MKRSLAIIPTEHGYAFDFTTTRKGFSCTAQRAVLTMLTQDGSDHIFPEATSQLTNIPALEAARGLPKLKVKLAHISHHLLNNQAPVDYPDELLTGLTLEPVPGDAVDRLKIVATLHSKNTTLLADF